jgi:hypothetical protein
LIDTLDADDAAPAEAAPTIAVARAVTAPTMPVVQASIRPDPISADSALRELAVATDRNRIVEILLGYASSTFDASVVFTVRDHLAFGWKAIGVPGHAHIEHVLIPLDVPSVIQAAVAAESGVIHGPLAPSTVNSYLYKVLGTSEPSTATAGVIVIGKRAVNVLYGHPNELTPLQVHIFQQVCQSAAEAYARLIAVQKKRR